MQRYVKTQELMSKQMSEIPSYRPFRCTPWTRAVFLRSHLTLSSHKSLSHPQPWCQLPGCPRHTSCGPPPPAPILFPAPPHSGTFCLPGSGDCEPLGTGTAQRPLAISRKSMWNGRERVKRQACLPGLDSSLQPLTAHSLHPWPAMTEGSNKIRTRNTKQTWAPPVPL